MRKLYVPIRHHHDIMHKKSHGIIQAEKRKNARAQIGEKSLLENSMVEQVLAGLAWHG